MAFLFNKKATRARMRTKIKEFFKEKNQGSTISRNICDSHWDGA
jgi:hypothetical protein